jgi:hypothetical protein
MILLRHPGFNPLLDFARGMSKLTEVWEMMGVVGMGELKKLK